MAVGCPAKCAKFLLITFNIIFWLSGAALLGIGIWLSVDDSILKYLNIIYVDGDDKYFQYAGYVMIAVGAFIFVTGFAGCCGAIRESPCLLGIYIFLLVVVMLVEITAGVLAFVFRNQIEQQVSEIFGKTLVKSNFTSPDLDASNNIIYTGFGTGMNLLQQESKCCGLNKSTDYLNPTIAPKFQLFSGKIPYSCCELDNPNARTDPQVDDLTEESCTTANAFDQGCREALKDWLEKNALILIGLGIGIACLEIFGIIFAVCVCRNPSSEKYE